MGNRYVLLRNNRQFGPFDARQIAEFVKAGKIDKTAVLREETSSTPKNICDIPELADLFNPRAQQPKDAPPQLKPSVLTSETNNNTSRKNSTSIFYWVGGASAIVIASLIAIIYFSNTSGDVNDTANDANDVAKISIVPTNETNRKASIRPSEPIIITNPEEATACLFYNEGENAATASAFVIEGNILVTALNSFPNAYLNKLQCFFPSAKNKSKLNVDLHFIDKERNILYLKYTSNEIDQPQAFKMASNISPATGEQVFVVKNGSTSSQALYSNSIVETKIEDRVTIDGADCFTLPISSSARIGSPITNKDGKLIGMLSGVYNNSFVAIPVNDLQASHQSLTSIDETELKKRRAEFYRNLIIFRLQESHKVFNAGMSAILNLDKESLSLPGNNSKNVVRAMVFRVWTAKLSPAINDAVNRCDNSIFNETLLQIDAYEKDYGSAAESQKMRLMTEVLLLMRKYSLKPGEDLDLQHELYNQANTRYASALKDLISLAVGLAPR